MGEVVVLTVVLAMPVWQVLRETVWISRDILKSDGA